MEIKWAEWQIGLQGKGKWWKIISKYFQSLAKCCSVAVSVITGEYLLAYYFSIAYSYRHIGQAHAAPVWLGPAGGNNESDNEDWAAFFWSYRVVTKGHCYPQQDWYFELELHQEEEVALARGPGSGHCEDVAQSSRDVICQTEVAGKFLHRIIASSHTKRTRPAWQTTPVSLDLIVGSLLFLTFS